MCSRPGAGSMKHCESLSFGADSRGVFHERVREKTRTLLVEHFAPWLLESRSRAMSRSLGNLASVAGKGKVESIEKLSSRMASEKFQDGRS